MGACWCCSRSMLRLKGAPGALGPLVWASVSVLVLDEDGGVTEAVLMDETCVGALSRVRLQVGALCKALPALGAFIGSLPQESFGTRSLCIVPEVPSSLGGGVPVVP